MEIKQTESRKRFLRAAGRALLSVYTGTLLTIVPHALIPDKDPELAGKGVRLPQQSFTCEAQWGKVPCTFSENLLEAFIWFVLFATLIGFYGSIAYTPIVGLVFLGTWIACFVYYFFIPRRLQSLYFIPPILLAFIFHLALVMFD